VIWPLAILFQRSGITINAAPGLFIITTALAGLLGWMVARFYSEPLNRRLRRKLVPRRTPGKEIAAGSSD
jgi:peptidoglycan/LPS O-acetylase OafA/YrhL